MSAAVVEQIEQLLLVLLVVEILYPVQISFREQCLASESFLLIGLIKALRRVLVIMTELSEARTKTEKAFRFLMIELGMLTPLIVALVSSMIRLRRNGDRWEDLRNV